MKEFLVNVRIMDHGTFGWVKNAVLKHVVYDDYHSMFCKGVIDEKNLRKLHNHKKIWWIQILEEVKYDKRN